MTSTSTVVPFGGKRPRQPSALPPASGECVRWPVAELPDERQCGEWLSQAIVGQSYERMLRSLWQHQPNLRLATEQLASYITPKWPATAGGTLLQVALERAARRADALSDQGQAFEGPLVAAYLEGLLEVIEEIAGLVVRGEDARGQVQRWEYFSQPLLPWAREHGIRSLMVHKALAPASQLVRDGLRTHMVARITNPVDAGYLVKYAGRT